jgi:P4 family phage/plasmid primase-like protien
MEIDINQALYHIRLLSGDANSKEYFQCFFDPKNEKEPQNIAESKYGTFTDLLEFFKFKQSQHCGVYVTMNVTNGESRLEKDIIKYRVLFADYDGMPEPVWPLQPHFKTARSPTNGHAIWFVDGIVDSEIFRTLQLRIATHSGTDFQVHDPSRVLRVAGTVHYKYPTTPDMYKVTEDYVQVVGASHKYTVSDIIKAFPLTEQQTKEQEQWLLTRKGNQLGDGLKENAFYNNLVAHLLTNKAPIANENIDGSHKVYQAAGYARDHGVPLATAKSLMWKHYNPRCNPPWDENQRWQFEQYIDNHYNHAVSVAGCKTAVGAFMSAPEVIEPIDGWEENSKINKLKEITVYQAVEDVRLKHRLSYNEAIAIDIALNEKSPHYNCALVFDGLIFNGCEILRHKKVFYAYQGRSYIEVDDDEIRSKIQSMFARFKPNDTFVTGVLKCLCDLVNQPKLRDCFKINAPDEDCSNLVPFKNMIVDIETKKTYPHTSNFFTFAEINYNYNSESKNLNLWNKTLETIFSGDQETITALKEFFGYCITTETKYQKFAMFVGLRRTGKGVLSHILTELVGKDNMSSPQLPDIINHPILNSIASKKIALFNEAHSVPPMRRDGVVSVLKSITGADSLTFDVKYKAARTLIFTCRIVMSTNNVPEFIDASGALAARAMVFPFRNSFAGKEDFDLKKKLSANIESIAQDCIRAYDQVRLRGKFTESEMMRDEGEEIQEDMNPLSIFFTRYCEIGGDVRTTTNELHSYYSICQRLSHDRNSLSEQKFSRLLKASSIAIRTCRMVDEYGMRVRGWIGIKIREDVKKGMLGGVANITNFPNRGNG